MVYGDFMKTHARIDQLPENFLEFFLPLHREFTPRQQALANKRKEKLAASLAGTPPAFLPASEATEKSWSIQLPEWCKDQRNQMTGPADDAELVVKMLNSGAPGVMLDLEDSMANEWDHLVLGTHNIKLALAGKLTYHDAKNNREVSIKPSNTVILTRARGLHMGQTGLFEESVSASLLDVAWVLYQFDPASARHPLTYYIPKSESAEEALWWRDLFQTLARSRKLPHDYIKCMALVESHPLAFQMEEFSYNLREHLLGLNLGRWDYMASLIHFNFEDPNWVLPDRNTIPHDVPFFQNLRTLIPRTCHRHGMLAIGGMTALYPSRVDAELNQRALAILEKDKHNEAICGMDGAWTGHPDQNEIAVKQFPFPNQLSAGIDGGIAHPDLRPAIGNKTITLDGTRAAVRTVIRYRNGVLAGKGASLLDGYMEDLATDRIYRLMIAQRVRHSVPFKDTNGKEERHTASLVSSVFDQELERILIQQPNLDDEARARFRRARTLSEEMIVQGKFDPT